MKPLHFWENQRFSSFINSLEIRYAIITKDGIIVNIPHSFAFLLIIPSCLTEQSIPLVDF